jgi:hypothetical protein
MPALRGGAVPPDRVNVVWIVEVLMKKLLAGLLIFGLGVGVGTLLQEKAPVAEAGQEPECAPLLVTGGGVVVQDMNGDGVFDPIAEAVRLLSWAFLGAPAPVRPCGRPLPATGQTKCYDASGTEILCDGAACPGQDGFYQTGCPSEGRFVVNDGGTPEDTTDDTVTDTCTGLMWQQDTADVNGDGQTIDDGSDALDWCGALAYCENLSFAGHDDWRLPNLRELQSIVDYGRVGPAIDPVFLVFQFAAYWSSTSSAGCPDLAWYVDSLVGYALLVDKGGVGQGDGVYVRAVRSGP